VRGDFQAEKVTSASDLLPGEDAVTWDCFSSSMLNFDKLDFWKEKMEI